MIGTYLIERSNEEGVTLMGQFDFLKREWIRPFMERLQRVSAKPFNIRGSGTTSVKELSRKTGHRGGKSKAETSLPNQERYLAVGPVCIPNCCTGVLLK